MPSDPCFDDDERFAAEVAIRPNVEAVGLPRADVSHVERLPIRRADDAVRLLQIIRHAHKLPAAGGEKVDVLAVLRHAVVRPPGPWVERVGEVERTVGPYLDIVRTVQGPPLVFVEDHSDCAVRLNRPQGSCFIRAGDQVAFGVKIHTVGATGRLQECRQPALRAPF
jgi:hypothetical protein